MEIPDTLSTYGTPGSTPVDTRSCGRVVLDAIKSALRAVADFFKWLFTACCCCFDSPAINSSTPPFDATPTPSDPLPIPNSVSPTPTPLPSPQTSSLQATLPLMANPYLPKGEPYPPFEALKEERAKVEEISLEDWGLPQVVFNGPLPKDVQAERKCDAFKRVITLKFKESVDTGVEPLGLYAKAREEILAFNQKLTEEGITAQLDETTLLAELESDFLLPFVEKLKEEVTTLLTENTENLKCDHLKEIFAYCEEEIERYKDLALSLELSIPDLEEISDFKETYFPGVERLISCLEKMHQLVNNDLGIQEKIWLLIEVAENLPMSEDPLWEKHEELREHMGAVLMPLTLTYFSSYQFRIPHENGLIQQINESYVLLAQKLGAEETPKVEVHMDTENDLFLAQQQALYQQEEQLRADGELAARLAAGLEN